MRVEMIGISPEQLMRCEAHAHSQWEVVVCLKGSGILRVGDREITFEPGVIVCQPPNLPHGETSDTGFQDIWVRVEDFVPPCQDFIPIFHDDEGKRFSTLLQMMYETFFRRESNGDRIVQALWDALYQLIVGWSAGSTANPLVSGLVHEMVLNLSNPGFDLGGCIRQTGYSADHFRRCFKHEMGTTPTAYFIALRVDHARRILDLPDSGGYTIKQISQLSGFTDPYYFSTMFRKNVGISPAEYRRRAQNAEDCME